MIRRLSLTGLLMVLMCTAQAQLVPNKIYDLLKDESFEAAEQYANDQIAVYKNHKKSYEKVIPYYHALGHIYWQKGDLVAAEHYYKQADSLIRIKQQYRKLQRFDLDVRDELSFIYLQGGHFSEAKTLLDQTAAFRATKYNVHNPFRFRSDLYYGYYYLEQQQADSAIFHLERYILCIRNTRFTRRTDLNRMGLGYFYLTQACLMKGDLKNAIKYAKTSYQVNNHDWTEQSGGKNTFNKINSANILSQSYRLSGDLKKALKWNTVAYDLYNKDVFIGSYQKIPLLINRGMIYWSMDSLAAARKCFLESSDLILNHIYLNFKFMSEYEREYFYNHQKENIDLIKSFFYHMQSAGLDTSDAFAQRIFELNLNTKGILLSASNRFMQQINSNSDPAVAKVYQEWRDLKNTLAYTLNTKDYQSVSTKVTELYAKIGEKEKFLQQHLNGEPDKIVKFEELQASLPVGSDLLEVMRVYKVDTVEVPTKKDTAVTLHLSEHSAYVYFILHPKSTDFDVLTAANGDEMDRKYFKGYRNGISINSPLQPVYNAYFKPLSSKFRNKEVFISSDGIYHLINLNTLFNKENGSFVIDNYDIKPVVSSKEFLRGAISPVKMDKVVLFGRPDFGSGVTASSGQTRSAIGTKVSDLPGTEKEVNNIRDILKKHQNSKVEVLVGKAASEDNVKNIESATVIHFATHGYFTAADSTANPMLTSGLLLSGVNEVSPNSKEDGILTAYEASMLDLKGTRIVVLSACETGLGEYKDGEGVFGLQRAFEVAGVDYIIMSLWKVDDEVTSLLMTKFYNYLSQGSDVPEAFYKAQLEIKKDHASAKYWGAFVLLVR